MKSIVFSLIAVIILTLTIACEIPAGPEGKPGEIGTDGFSPYIGENGNWWVNNTDTGVYAASVSLKNMTLDVGRTDTLVPIIFPATVTDNSPLQWTSSDPQIATVDNDGNINAISRGKAYITVTTVDGRKLAESAITVNSVYVLKQNGYWADGIWVELENIDGGTAFGLTVSEDKVYVAGFYRDNGLRKACFWFDGVRIDIPDEADISTATDIAVSNDKIYISGWYSNGILAKACYWIDGWQRIDLPIGAGNSLASEITISDGKIFIAGYYGELYAEGVDRPDDVETVTNCYWVDGKRIDLPGETTLSTYLRMFVQKNSVYIAGTLYDRHPNGPGNTINTSVYWINGEIFYIPDYKTHHLDITAYNNKVYVTGNAGDASYWINGEKIDLFSPDYSASAITVSAEGVVYVAGYGNGYVCYWVDGKKIDLGNASFVNSYSSRILVVSE